MQNPLKLKEIKINGSKKIDKQNILNESNNFILKYSKFVDELSVDNPEIVQQLIAELNNVLDYKRSK